MNMISLTAAQFDEFVQNNDIVVVDFWAKWCGPCLAFAPIFESVSQRHPDVVFAKVNIDEQVSLAQDFTIRSIPYLMIFRREFAVYAQAGVLTASDLDKLVYEAKKIDLASLKQQIQR